MNKELARFLETHEWAFLEGDTAKIGISSYAAMHLGDIVFIDLPQVGTILTKDSSFGAIESVKSASDLYAPVSGEVIAVNQAVIDNPETISNDPFAAWLIEVKLSKKAEFEQLLDVAAYEKTLE